MARGYTDPGDPEAGYRPSRPMRRAESQRGYADLKSQGYDELKARGFTAHYAESPVIQTEPQQQPRTLPRRGQAGHNTRSRNSTLTRPRSEAARSASRASRPGTRQQQVTRSKSWGARPAGVVVYNRHGEPVDTGAAQMPPSKPPSTIGVGYRPNTALR